MSAILSEGELLFSQGKLAEAKDIFWSAIKNCPGNATAWNNLAVVAQAEGHLKAAEGYLEKSLEVAPDFWEARFNLAQLLFDREQLIKAQRELKKLLKIRPGDLPAIKLLAESYLKQGKPKESLKVLQSSTDLGAMKDFIDSLWLGIRFFSLSEHLSVEDRLVGLMEAVLKLIDGQKGRSRRFKLIGLDPENKQSVTLENLTDFFYYKEQKSLNLITEEEKSKIALTIGDHQDWLLFHQALQAEMQAEGGCLGDFTQTKKVLRNEPAFTKYKLEDTLNYFRKNLGPCDCHVVRAVLV